MQISVLQNGFVIGTGFIEHLDPPMGVAFGRFLPGDRYDRDQHANIVDGAFVADRGQSLSVDSEEHGRLTSASVSIEDWANVEFGLTIFFQDGYAFEALFSNNSDYISY